MKAWGLVVAILFLLLGGNIILHSIAPHIFPLYYLFIILGLVFFAVFSRLDLDVMALFSWHIYVASVLFLLAPLVIGEVTRGTVRWIPIGSLTLQPAEIVRPFLILFFANFFYRRDINLRNLAVSAVLLLLPVILILLQPSLGVSILTVIGYLGVIAASGVKKKSVVLALILGILAIPVTWLFLADYQKDRILGFLNPGADPSGAGYNSLQSMISVGSGRLFGRGLGQGVQTQLDFLPERHTDFVFASMAEELGFLGASLLTLGVMFLLYRIALIIDNAENARGRAFVSGVFLALLAQVIIHIGMNMGLLPITGVPLPLVSAGGSSLLATMITLGMVVQARKKV